MLFKMTSSLCVNHYFPEVRTCKEISSNVKFDLFLNFIRLACSNNQKNRYLMSRIGNTKQTRSDRIPISSCLPFCLCLPVRSAPQIFLSDCLTISSCPPVSICPLFRQSPSTVSSCPPASIYLPVHLPPSIFLSTCLHLSSCPPVSIYLPVRLSPYIFLSVCPRIPYCPSVLHTISEQNHYGIKKTQTFMLISPVNKSFKKYAKKVKGKQLKANFEFYFCCISPTYITI